MGVVVLPRALQQRRVRTGRKPKSSRNPGPSFSDGPAANAAFGSAPAAAASPRNYKAWGDALEDLVYRTATREHVPLPGPEDGVGAGRHGERVSRAPRAGLAGKARRGRRRAAQEVLGQAGRDRRPAAPRGTEDRAAEVAGDQPDDGHRVVGGRQPARRAVRRAPLERAAGGLVRRARHRARDQGAFRRRAAPKRMPPRCASSRMR